MVGCVPIVLTPLMFFRSFSLVVKPVGARCVCVCVCVCVRARARVRACALFMFMRARVFLRVYVRARERESKEFRTKTYHCSFWNTYIIGDKLLFPGTR